MDQGFWHWLDYFLRRNFWYAEYMKPIHEHPTWKCPKCERLTDYKDECDYCGWQSLWS